MQVAFHVPNNYIKEEYQYYNDILEENRQFPMLTIGTDSYIVSGVGEADYLNVYPYVYNFHIGRYTSVSNDADFIFDRNHDYKRVCQGCISGVPITPAGSIKRKGSITIMNDCWIGEHVTIVSGVTIGNGAVVGAYSVVTKSVPPYAIVGGNPARIIGYRFTDEQIEALNLIRWWNWSTEKIHENANDLTGDIEGFINKHLEGAKKELADIVPVDITPVPKSNKGEEKILLYIPDFEQDYPTYPHVIESFIRSYSDTNHELLLYIKEDDFLDDKLKLLDGIFSKYEEANCYINLYVGNIEDERGLFCQVDAYITNRSTDNVYHMDLADMFGIPVISSVDVPVFDEKSNIQYMVKTNKQTEGQTNRNEVNNIKNGDDRISENISGIVKTMKSLADTQKQIQDHIYQISVNQCALDNSIENIKYELPAEPITPVYPKIYSIEETLDKIIKEHKSICRFGDGEFATMTGKNIHKFQHYDPIFAKRLKEVIASDIDNILICIPDMYGSLSKYNYEGRLNIRMYLTAETRRENYSFFDMDRTYGNTWITRPYAIYADNNTDAPKKRFDALRKIWDGKKLLIIEGEKTRMGIGNDLFENAEDIVRILGPAEQAFDRYDDLLSEALKQDKERLVLIALGATATILAYDLALAGYQALDIGHIDMEYEWMKRGEGRKNVDGKYNNESADGNIVNDIDDPIYEEQIIARIY